MQPPSRTPLDSAVPAMCPLVFREREHLPHDPHTLARLESHGPSFPPEHTSLSPAPALPLPGSPRLATLSLDHHILPRPDVLLHTPTRPALSMSTRCIKKACFGPRGLRGSTALRCADHRREADEDVVNARCSVESCSRSAVFGDPSLGAPYRRYCLEHRCCLSLSALVPSGAAHPCPAGLSARHASVPACELCGQPVRILVWVFVTENSCGCEAVNQLVCR